MDPSSIRLSGAVPLDAPPAAAGRPPGEATSAQMVSVVDVSEATFEREVLQRSMSVPVVLDFWASWCGPCRQLSPILEQLAVEAAGAWVLAKVDCDANPRLSQAAGVQGIPAVKAVVNGQVVGEFTGALPENQVRQWIGQLLAAVRDGTFGAPGQPVPPDDGSLPPEDADLAVADGALASGDLDGAEAAFRRFAERLPADPAGRTGLARVDLLRRAATLDVEALRARLAAAPADIDATLGIADALLLADRPEEAFALLVEAVRSTSGPERDSARTRLLSLFDVLGDGDPAVSRARRDLASALF